MSANKLSQLQESLLRIREQRPVVEKMLLQGTAHTERKKEEARRIA